MENLPDLAVIQLSYDLPLEDLYRLCESSFRFQKLLCGNPDYWQNRYQQTISLEKQSAKPEDRTWENHYLRAVRFRFQHIYFGISETEENVDFDYYYKYNGRFYSASTLELVENPPKLTKFDINRFDSFGSQPVAILIGDVNDKMSGVLYQIDRENELQVLHDVTASQYPLKFKFLLVPDLFSGKINPDLRKLPRFPLKVLSSSLQKQFRAIVEIFHFMESHQQDTEAFTSLIFDIDQRTVSETNQWIKELVEEILAYHRDSQVLREPYSAQEIRNLIRMKLPYFLYFPNEEEEKGPIRTAIIYFPSAAATAIIRINPETQEIVEIQE